jgi:hypothetical protein
VGFSSFLLLFFITYSLSRISKGHFGRTRQIKIQIPEGVLAFLLEEDDLIKKLEGVPWKLEIREVGKR